MFLFHSRFIETLLFVRNCYLRGILGSGKTLLAVALGDWIIRNVPGIDYFVCNFPCDLPTRADGLLLNSVVVLDEASSIIDARDFMTNPRMYGQYARHLGTIWLYPSYGQIDKRNRPMIVERVYAFNVIPGELWVYRWELDKGDVSDRGIFWLLFPTRFYGRYLHVWPTATDGGIGAAWQNTVRFVGRDIADAFHYSENGPGSVSRFARTVEQLQLQWRGRSGSEV